MAFWVIRYPFLGSSPGHSGEQCHESSESKVSRAVSFESSPHVYRLTQYIEPRAANFPSWRNLNHFNKILSMSFIDGRKFEDISKASVAVPCVQDIINPSGYDRSSSTSATMSSTTQDAPGCFYDASGVIWKSTCILDMMCTLRRP